jgi:hypothetical protein
MKGGIEEGFTFIIWRTLTRNERIERFLGQILSHRREEGL